jgi:hypothetical protein
MPSAQLPGDLQMSYETDTFTDVDLTPILPQITLPALIPRLPPNVALRYEIELLRVSDTWDNAIYQAAFDPGSTAADQQQPHDP